MKQHYLRLLLLGLATGVASSSFAQSDLPYIFTARPKYTFSAALKIRPSGPKVKFGDLGNIPYQAVELVNGTTTPTGNYFYHDGLVARDGIRGGDTRFPPETTVTVTNGAITTTSKAVPYDNGTRYRTFTTVVDATNPAAVTTTTTPTGDFLSFQEGQTRVWTYQDPSQVSDGFIEMHAFSARTEGATAEADSGATGGFDLQLGRELGTIGKNAQWGFAVSVGVNDINAKTSGRVASTLVTETGRFSLLGRPAPISLDSSGNPIYPYAAPSAIGYPLVDENGNPFPSAGSQTTTADRLETTTPLGQTPETNVMTTQAGAAQVDGRWQVKGAFYTARLGPSFRYQLAKRISFSGNAGVALAYIGSVYSVQETLLFPNGALPNGAPILRNPLDNSLRPAPSSNGEIRDRAFRVGFYGELNAEFWLSFRTGLFAGVVYENVGSFKQTIGGRTASVSIGSGTAFRLGIINRF